MKNSVTIDVEDWYHCLDPNPDNWPRYEDRIVRSVQRVLEILHRASTKATFFVLGHIAVLHPELVRTIAEAGHEVASHGTWHRFVYDQDPREFEDDVSQSLAALRSITGSSILGYRAPYFSITDRSRWALALLRKLGVAYDSSIFPVYNHRYGIRNAARLPWRTDEGLIELPLSTYRACGVNIPCGGGVYFRFLPYWVTRHLLARLNAAGEPIIFYLHPWELDDGQPRISLPRALSLRHYFGLSRTAGKLSSLLRDFRFVPMREAVSL
jgi:polysaccharide deacetylase family protein (PEP-CTERM system associated)